MPVTVKSLKRVLSAAVAAAVIFTSPGIGVYNALAQTVGVDAVNVGIVRLGAGNSAIDAGLSGNAANGLGSLNLGSGLAGAQGLDLSSRMISQGASIPASLSSSRLSTLSSFNTGRASGLAASQVDPAVSSPAGLSLKSIEGEAARSLRPAVRGFQRLSAGIEAILGSNGASQNSSLSSSYSEGSALQAEMTRQHNAGASTVEPVAAGITMGDGGYVARPAGADISAAVQSGYTGDPAPPAPPAKSDRGAFFEFVLSLIPRAMAAVALAAPAFLIGIPLVQSMLALPLLTMKDVILIEGGSILAISSLANAVMPFMGRSTPKFFRLVPGVAMVTLGAATMAAPLFIPFSLTAVLAGAAMGSFIALNGWGLYKFGKDSEEKADRSLGAMDRLQQRVMANFRAKVPDPMRNKEVITTFFGAIGAVAGAGLVLKAVAAGTAVSMFSVLAFPIALAVLAPWAVWAWYGFHGTARGAAIGIQGVGAVANSVWNDTLRGRRLTAFNDAALKQSPWNAIWLSLRWVPIWGTQAVEKSLAVLVAGWAALWQAPAFFLWGAAERLSPQSKATMFFATWARGMFNTIQGSKVSLYNLIAETLVPYANSKNPLVSALGRTGMRANQLAWAGIVVAMAPAAMALDFLLAFRSLGQTYDPAKHSIENLSLPKDPLPGQVPNEPAPEKVTTWPYEIAAFAVAMTPLVYFGVPMLLAATTGIPTLGTIPALAYFFASFLIGLSPAAPDSRFIRVIPGLLLAATGIAMAATGLGVFTGTLGALGGLAYATYADHLVARPVSKNENSLVRLGAFAGVVALTAGLGAAISGMTGMTAIALSLGMVLASPLLLIHSPPFIAQGFKTLILGVGYSFRNILRVLNFWDTDTAYGRNLDESYDYWIKKSPMNGSWLWTKFVPTQLMRLAEVTTALGAALAMFDAVKLLNWAHIDLGAMVLPYLYLIPGGAVLAGALSAIFAAGLPSLAIAGVAVMITVAGFAVTTLGLRAASLFAWGASHELSPTNPISRFIAGFTRSLLEQGEGSKSIFDSSVGSLTEWMSRKSPVSGRPTLLANVAFAVARLAQSALWMPLLVVKLPYNLIKAAIDGIGNATRSPEKQDPSQDDPDPFLSK